MGKVKETGPVFTGDGSEVSPEFKAYVAHLCRLQAETLTDQQRHAEAAAKIASAEKLERALETSR